MKSKLMAVSVFLLLAVMATPVMAKPIGPQKAVNNPHIMITPEGVELVLPSGVILEWMADTEAGAIDFVLIFDASKFKIPNAMPLTMSDLMGLMLDPEAALEAENVWGYIPYNVLVELFILEIMAADPTLTYEQAQAIAIQMASMWPEGIYVRFVNVGKTWDA